MIMTPELLVAMVGSILGGSILSFLLEYFPGLRQLWDKIGDSKVRLYLVMVLSFGLPWLFAGAACLNISLGVVAVCPANVQSAIDLLVLGASVYVASQVSFQALVKPASNKFNA